MDENNPQSINPAQEPVATPVVDPTPAPAEPVVEPVPAVEPTPVVETPVETPVAEAPVTAETPVAEPTPVESAAPVAETPAAEAPVTPAEPAAPITAPAPEVAPVSTQENVTQPEVQPIVAAAAQPIIEQQTVVAAPATAPTEAPATGTTVAPTTNKKSSPILPIILAVVVVIIGVVFAIMMINANKPTTASNNPNHYESGNGTDDDDDDDDDDNGGSLAGTGGSTLTCLGFQWEKIAGYEYDCDSDSMAVLNSTADVMMAIALLKGDYSLYRTNIADVAIALRDSYDFVVGKYGTYTATNGAELLAFQVKDGSKLGYFFIARATSTVLFQGIVLNEDNTLDESNLDVVAKVIYGTNSVANRVLSLEDETEEEFTQNITDKLVIPEISTSF